MASIEDRLNRPTISWRPSEGDSIAGTVVDIASHEHPEYGTSPVITVLTEAGDEYVWHAFGTVAKAELAKRRPKVGDTIGVKFCGVPEGRSYKLWRVVVEHLEPEPAKELDWDAVAESAGAVPDYDEEPLSDEEPPVVDDRPASTSEEPF